MKRAVFLDRDGTLNRDVGYPDSFPSIHIYPFSCEAVRLINRTGFLAVVITNQSGVARGLIEEKELVALHNRMIQAFSEKGARIDGFYYCPHHLFSLDARYKKDCACRKPLPGLGLQAARDLDIDLSGSYMIGDKPEDLLFGRAIGASPILVLTGYGRESLAGMENSGARPAHVSETLLQAVEWIVVREEDGRPGPAAGSPS